MAKKGEQAEVEQPTVELPEGETPEPEAQTKTFTQEELDAQIAKAKETGKATAWEEYQGIQRVVSQKEKTIKELEAQIAQPSDDDLAQLLIEERRGKVSEFGESDPIIPRLEAIVTKRKKAQEEARLATYYRQADVVYKSAEEVFGDDVDTLHTIRTYIRAGDFDLAEKKIAKAKGNKPTEPKGKEGEGTEDAFEKRLEEEKRKWAEEHGLLTTETGGPSASSMSAQDAKAKYIAGEITAEEAKRRGADFS